MWTLKNNLIHTKKKFIVIIILTAEHWEESQSTQFGIKTEHKRHFASLA